MGKFAKVVTVGGVIFGFIFILFAFHSETSAGDAPDEVVTIDQIKDKQADVKFPHKAHLPRLEGKCGNCHVNADGGGGLKPELLAKPDDMAAAMKHPFHVQCKGCHKAEGKGPTKCGECHK